MTVVRYARPVDNLDRIFDQLTSSWFSGAQTRRTATPTVSADVRDGALQVYVDLPGVPREAVSVEVADRALTIKVDHSTERSQLQWARSLRIDRSLDADAVAASYADGRLTVTVPAAPKPEPRVVNVEIGAPAADPAIEATADTVPVTNSSDSSAESTES